MISILKAKLLLFIKKPLTFVAMTGLSLIFAYLIGSIEHSKITVPVYTEIPNIEETYLWETMNESDIFTFSLVDEDEADRLVVEGDAEASVELEEDSYRLKITTHTSNVNILRQFLDTIYIDLKMNDTILSSAESMENINVEQLKYNLENRNESLTFSIESNYFRGNKTVVIDNSLQSLFGFTLFFVIYTIAYNVVHILQEKQLGVWDRMILSPLKKWQMYVGNLLYSFLIGYLQVVMIFVLFRYIIGIDFHGGFGKALIVLIPYVFSIVALSMFLVGVSKSVQQFNIFIPLISVSFAMIGGAYWPLEIVSSEIMLTLSNFVPVKYGMEGLKLATIYQAPIGDLMLPISVMLLMGVVLMGIGINVMERRNV